MSSERFTSQVHVQRTCDGNEPATQTIVNLPVKDLKRARESFTTIGFRFVDRGITTARDGSDDHLPNSEGVEVRLRFRTCVAFMDDNGWSIYGAERSQPVAISRKWEGAEKRLNQAKTVAVGCDQLP